jgi:lipopolysaccharide/colanic/teichoic acid biosynthesis glycosyltransferase
VNRYVHSRRKRALDVTVAGALLVLSAPVVAAAAAALRRQWQGPPI